MLQLDTMNDNLQHSRSAENCSLNSGYGLDLDKINPLGELNFFFGNNSSAASTSEGGDHHAVSHRQQLQSSNNKRSMDDVLKKLTSKMHINNASPGEESAAFKEK